MRAAFSLIALLTGASFAQDLTITSKITTIDGPSETTISYLSRDHLRIAQGGGTEMILDLEAGEMTVLEENLLRRHQKRSRCRGCHD